VSANFHVSHSSLIGLLSLLPSFVFLFWLRFSSSLLFASHMNDHCIINPNSLYSTLNRLNDLQALVASVFDDSLSQKRTLDAFKELEFVTQISDFEGHDLADIKEIFQCVKPTKKRSALLKALLAVLPPPLPISGSFIVLALALATLLCCALLYGLPCVLLCCALSMNVNAMVI
jgi:hypothetical protein